jgi:hypothetical protein
MATRTFASTWKQFEKLAKRVQDAKKPSRKDLKALDELGRRTNRSRIVDALATLFVRGYQGLEEFDVEFATSNGGGYPDWVANYEPDEKVIRVNPLGVYRFLLECDQSVETLKTSTARESFVTYRYQAYLAELRKLPAQHLLFLQLLKEVAKARQVTRVEKKGGGTEEVEDEAYMVMLWAFKELEYLLGRNGVDLRAEYSILWYESDWFLGRR